MVSLSPSCSEQSAVTSIYTNYSDLSLSDSELFFNSRDSSPRRALVTPPRRNRNRCLFRDLATADEGELASSLNALGFEEKLNFLN